MECAEVLRMEREPFVSPAVAVERDQTIHGSLDGQVDACV